MSNQKWEPKWGPQTQNVRVTGIGSGRKMVPITLTEEEKQFSRRLWWSVLSFAAVFGGLIYLFPKVMGVIMLTVFVLVCVMAVAAGARKGNGL